MCSFFVFMSGVVRAVPDQRKGVIAGACRAADVRAIAPRAVALRGTSEVQGF